MNSIFLNQNPGTVAAVYPEALTEALALSAGLDPAVRTKEDVLREPELYAGTEYVFSTWGMPAFTEEEIARVFPSLKAVFYAAGSVQGFALPFIRSGVKVFSAWAANAVPVGEFTAAEIALSCKGFWASSRQASRGDYAGARRSFGGYPGCFEQKIGVIGAGMVGKEVIRRLKQYRFHTLVFDPFLPDSAAEELGVEKCSLEELFSQCIVVSNHLANNRETKGMLNYGLFSRMLPCATFINTGRGAQVVEQDLVKILTERPDLTALLDVTDPEPPVESSPFFGLDNCILTPHIAGSSGREVARMAEYMAEEFAAFSQGKPVRYMVTEEMLRTMA
ncbi:MAG: hydroxyacid dehydrogenase [Abditibacteriota bacterium]|nr:hydroxyacid dehydrogenase [Abditibacteriota bacterium]